MHPHGRRPAAVPLQTERERERESESARERERERAREKESEREEERAGETLIQRKTKGKEGEEGGGRWPGRSFKIPSIVSGPLRTTRVDAVTISSRNITESALIYAILSLGCMPKIVYPSLP
jgi:hypothetical protein